ncbi:hypothetical protein [Phytohabitans houttuyneae]|uniref:Uncharacterized protein n=1 Tax=Phytohabitans houttuyneae TaxID=1076126 RepID=A0A6V8K7K2_9ACTN|nr:hypothetical protein [Phytohabitans houttuyneae]GFJ79500.1 hypothetical protein Phou_036800 [Phytohabitans houttuyneae]
MSVQEYEINKNYDHDRRTVKATKVVTTDDFVDFHDGLGLVLRLRKSAVYTVERKQPTS